MHCSVRPSGLASKGQPLLRAPQLARVVTWWRTGTGAGLFLREGDMAEHQKVKPLFTEEVEKIPMRGRNRTITVAEMQDGLAERAGLTPAVAAALGKEIRLDRSGVAPRKQVGYKKPTREEG